MKADNAFDRHISQTWPGEANGHLKEATVYVADTAYACRLWFEANELKPTAADIVAMTKLIIDENARRIARRDAQEGSAE